MFDTTLTLLTETITQDAALNEVITYSEKEVPVRKARSVYANEFYQAAAQGLHPAAVLVIFFGDYEGEKVAKWNGKVYAITRVYQKPSSDDLEITLDDRLEYIDGVHEGGSS